MSVRVSGGELLPGKEKDDDDDVKRASDEGFGQDLSKRLASVRPTLPEGLWTGGGNASSL